MDSIAQSVIQQGPRAGADRFYSTATVVSVNPIAHTATIDVGATDTQGNKILISGVPIQPQSPPAAGDTVNLAYGNANAHSLYVSGGQLGGGSSQSSISTAAQNVVNSLNGIALAVTLAAGAGITITESGQTITVANSVTPGVGVQHNDTAVATELAIDLEDTASVTWTVTDDSANHRVKISAAVTAVSVGPSYPVVQKTANYAATLSDCVMVFTWSGSTNVTCTLPAASSCPGKLYIIKSYLMSGTYGVLTATTGSDTIDNVASPYGPTIQTAVGDGWAHFVSDGVSNWILTTTN